MAKKEAGKRKKEISPEAREKLSRLAKERHAAGKFGGSEFGKLGGRPRKDRASKRVAEAAQRDESAEAITQVFKDAVHPSQPMGIRLKGAEAWLGVEREEAKVALQEEEARDKQYSREELIQILTSKLTSGTTASILRRQIEETISSNGDGDVVDAVVVEEENPFIKKARERVTD